MKTTKRLFLSCKPPNNIKHTIEYDRSDVHGNKQLDDQEQVIKTLNEKDFSILKVMDLVIDYLRKGNTLSVRAINMFEDRIQTSFKGLKILKGMYPKKTYDIDAKNKILQIIHLGLKFRPSFIMFLLGDKMLQDPILKFMNYTFDCKFITSLKGSAGSAVINDTFEKLSVEKNVIFNIMQNELEEAICKKEFIPSSIISALLAHQDIVMTPILLEEIIKNHKVLILEQHVSKDAKLSTEELESACLAKNDRYKKVKLILENKVEPTEKAFNNILKINGVFFGINDDMYKYGDIHSNDIKIKIKIKKKKNPNNANAIIDLFLQYGYNLTYDNLKTALEHRIIINNIDRFDIKFDVSYYHICSKINIYPYAPKNVSPDALTVTNACKHSYNLYNIKKLIEKNKLAPDTSWLHEASKLHHGYRDNVGTIRYLISIGCKSDFECIYDYLKRHTNYVGSLLINAFKGNNNSPSKNTNENVEKTTSNSTNSVTVSNEPEKITHTIPSNEPVITSDESKKSVELTEKSNESKKITSNIYS